MKFDAKLVEELLKQMEACVDRIAELNKSLDLQQDSKTNKAA